MEHKLVDKLALVEVVVEHNILVEHMMDGKMASLGPSLGLASLVEEPS